MVSDMIMNWILEVTPESGPIKAQKTLHSLPKLPVVVSVVLRGILKEVGRDETSLVSKLSVVKSVIVHITVHIDYVTCLER